MPLTQIITVPSGTGASSAFVIDGDRPVVIFIGSHAARGWGFGYATSSAGAEWHAAYRPNADGYAGVCSGGGSMGGVMRYPLSPWARLEVRGAALALSSLTTAVSVTVTQLNRM